MTALLRPVGRLLDLALPAACAGCGVEGAALCERCLPAVRGRIALPPGTPMGLGDGPPHPLLQLEWCAPFAGTTRRALHALKYAGEQRLAVPLGEALADRWQRAGADGDVLVPVPVHAQRRRERGYDQAVLLARVGLPCTEAVVRARATAPQFRLDRRHRAANMADAFSVTPQVGAAIHGRWVVLVDDVVTTGSTLCEVAHALLGAGARAVSGLTVARER
jgi:ComF family protein